MKKIYSFVVLSIICLLSFSGCTVKGSSSAAGIEFIHDVFYVDYEVKTFLDYKVYPLTAENVYVNFDIENDFSIDSYFNFTKGYVEVINERFTSIKVTAKLNEFTDVCEVKLKEYPESVKFEKSTDYIDANSLYPLDLQGVFDGETLSCKDRQYVFKLESSNPSIIEIVSEEDLLVRSTGRSGEARIDVKICDSLNQEKTGLKASITLKVVENIDNAFIALDKLRINDGDVVDLTMNVNEQKNLSVYYFGSNNFLNEITEYTVFLTNDYLFDIIETGNGYALKLKDLPTTEEGEDYSVNLTIQSTALNSSGLPYIIKCELRVQIL